MVPFLWFMISAIAYGFTENFVLSVIIGFICTTVVVIFND